jgi:hypothetical protein
MTSNCLEITKLFVAEPARELERCLRICFKAFGIENEKTDNDNGRHSEGK